jgi:hypothetical protein
MQHVMNDDIKATRKIIRPVHVHPTENSTSTVLIRRSVTYLRETTNVAVSTAGPKVRPSERIHHHNQHPFLRCSHSSPPGQNPRVPVKLVYSSTLVPTPHVILRQQDLFLLVDDALALVDAAEGAVVAVHFCHVGPV